MKKAILLAIMLPVAIVGQAQDNHGITEKLARQIQGYDQAVTQYSLSLLSDYYQAEKEGDQNKINSFKREFNEISSKNHTKVLKFIRKNPDSPVSARATLTYLQILKGFSANTQTIIMDRIPTFVTETILHHAKERYDLLNNDVKESGIGKELAEYLQTVENTYMAIQNIQIGKLAPDFTIPDPEGTPFSLHEIKCKVKLIDFWASWCNPCRETNPEMVALYNEFNSQGLEIISISLDSDKSEWLEAIEEDGLLWPYHGSELKSRTNTIATIYNVKVIPTTYLLDAENKIIAINLKGESLKQKIKELMK